MTSNGHIRMRLPWPESVPGRIAITTIHEGSDSLSIHPCWHQILRSKSFEMSPPGPQRRSPLLPTATESLLLAIYPATLLLGSLFSLLDPSARSAPYNAATRSHPSEQAPSYFAQKSNIFNILFVKVGWFWTTAAFLFFLLTHGGPVSRVTPRRVQGLLRYSLITTWWAIVTRWFFGPGLIDRLFLWTGGACQADAGIASAAACKAIGGTWLGGHDLSGHVFMLVLSSVFLWQEVLYVALRSAGVEEQRTVASGVVAEDIKSAETERPVPDPRQLGQQPGFQWGLRLTALMAALSWWMLLTTAIYFHTWFEKVYIMSYFVSSLVSID